MAGGSSRGVDGRDRSSLNWNLGALHLDEGGDVVGNAGGLGRRGAMRNTWAVGALHVEDEEIAKSKT